MFKYLSILCLSFAVANCESCADGWETFGSSCFSFLPVYTNWTEARAVCQSQEPSGVDLAIVNEANTLRLIYEYINGYNLAGSFWIGGSDINFEGDWHWIDDSRIDYGTPFWALNNDLFGWEHEPSGGEHENCLAINDDKFYFFDDMECGLSNHPICMYNP